MPVSDADSKVGGCHDGREIIDNVTRATVVAARVAVAAAGVAADTDINAGRNCPCPEPEVHIHRDRAGPVIRRRRCRQGVHIDAEFDRRRCIARARSTTAAAPAP